MEKLTSESRSIVKPGFHIIATIAVIVVTAQKINSAIAVILLWLTPDDFTCQRGNSRLERFNLFTFVTLSPSEPMRGDR